MKCAAEHSNKQQPNQRYLEINEGTVVKRAGILQNVFVPDGNDLIQTESLTQLGTQILPVFPGAKNNMHITQQRSTQNSMHITQPT